MNSLELNDETLGAYLDGALDDAARGEVERRLATDAGARLRLERLRTVDARLADALPLRGQDHFQEAMIARIRHGEAAGTLPARRRQPLLPWAAAAALGGVIVGALLARATMPAMQLDSSLAQLLQDAPSGTATADGHARVLLTVRTPDAGACRVFEVEGPRGGDGLACHGANGWELKAWDATGAQAGGYRTAGASALVDAAVDAMQASPALEPADEAGLIARDWRSATQE